MKKLILTLLMIISLASLVPPTKAQGHSDEHPPEVVQARRDAARALSERMHRGGRETSAETRYFHPNLWPSEYAEVAGPNAEPQGDDDYGLSYCILCGCGKERR
jgi:hypothetical protein